ncbi:MAG: histidine kinase N-terminal 7TM domain-containing protein [Anaerolineae bacterium]
MPDSLLELLQVINEILASSIVILAFSMLLYNLTRDLHNRVARTSGAVLACVTIPYVCDVFLSLQPDLEVSLVVARLQWVGIAFIPAALFHLSDALLATTGLPSRGRRKRIIRILYAMSALFLVLATVTDSIIVPTIIRRIVSFDAGPLAWLFITYFISVVIVTFINMQRARQRSLTRTTRRRMGYLQYAILLPAIGIFPFSIFISPADEQALSFTLLVVGANLFVIAMLIFLSYPLSFFGSNKPDRIVKVELLHFLLRGPGTGLLALATILTIGRATRVLGLDNDDFLPFGVVAAVLMWQWGIHLLMPTLEYWLIYRGEDEEQMARLRDLNERIVTRNDLLQYTEATLAAVADQLRAKEAFLLLVRDGDIEPIQSVGMDHLNGFLQEQEGELKTLLTEAAASAEFIAWGEYQLLPLRSRRTVDEGAVVGLLGVRATRDELAVTEQDTLRPMVQRLEQTIEDFRLQAEIFNAVEGLLPQITSNRQRADEMEFGTHPAPDSATDRDEFYEQVRAALRHYWGGPGITRSRLHDLHVVQKLVAQGENPTVALRTVLQQAIEQQRPAGERSLTAPEWTIYNILTLRFLEGKKVRDVARRMSMSEADLYRKQRLAIEALSTTLHELEAAARSETAPL